jgi:hypothetical protein
MDVPTLNLPGGYVDENGGLHQEVELIPLSGREEELLASNRRLESASLVTTILSRCLQRIGSISPVTENITRDLLIADRQYLLLKLREVTFGDQVQATIPCPWPDCGKQVDIEFLIKDIPVIESEVKGPTYKMELSREAAFSDNNGKQYRKILFRLPNGDDQEKVSQILAENEALALTMLLERCILQLGPLKNPEKEIILQLSPPARMEIELSGL